MPKGAVSLHADQHRLVFGREMKEKLRLEEVKAVRIRVNRGARLLGLLLLRNGEPGPYHIYTCSGKLRNVASLACRTALKRIEPPPEPGYYRAREEAKDFLVIDFNIKLGDHQP
jgi:hypothetical protein